MPEIIEGGLDAFRALAYDAPTNDMVLYLDEINQDYDRRLTTRAREHVNRLREEIRPRDFRDIKRTITASMRRLGRIWVKDMIQELESLGDLQHPQAKMREYIMSEPSVRKRFYNQRCEGYAEAYHDRFPGRIGDDDPVYRSVMDGILQEDEEGNVFYMDYDSDFEDEMVQTLEVEEKNDILRTFDNVRAQMSRGVEDPTSQYNAQL